MEEEAQIEDIQIVVEPVAQEARISAPAGSTANAVRLHGEANVRGFKRVPLSPIDEGRFSRMFRRLSAMPPLPEEILGQLAEQMREVEATSGWDGTTQPLDNPDIPAGFTYLGQFIDHDVTFDPASVVERQNDPDALHNFRTPRFDLDSIYGSGPIDEPFQYRRGTQGMRMLFEPNQNRVEDLPRNTEGVALIGDPRNDENTIVGQLQLLFLKLHDRFAQQVEEEGNTPEEQRFSEAQRRVRWHYQWIVVHDFLPRILGRAIFDQLYEEDQDSGIPQISNRFYHPKRNAYMPIEFSAAAYRYGHSQIRGIYNLSDSVRDRPIFTTGPLASETQDLRGFRPLPSGWTVDWRFFFAIQGSTPQPSRLIDTKLVPALFDLPDGGGSLALRNLKRGQALGLPSGQDVAKYLKIPPLTTEQLQGAPEPTPLWFYILKESETITGGRHLGPVGATIVGEVLLGLLRLDPQSWYSINPAWKPTIPDADGDGVISVSDLLTFVG